MCSHFAIHATSHYHKSTGPLAFPLSGELTIHFQSRRVPSFHLATMQITVLEYNPEWANAFQRIKASLLTILNSIPISSIEHVGSTSIPGLAAKPIIDIDVVVEPKHIPMTCALLSTNGYTYNPEPWGIDRMSFRYDKHTHDAGATRPTEDGDLRRAVYVNIPEGEMLRNHLLVRKVLSGCPELVAEYSEVKRELARREWKGIGAYGGAKTAILERIMARGELDVEENATVRQSNGNQDSNA
jgi:GrpB-like predicted nucleotidyltransferase (UPF0157 family)